MIIKTFHIITINITQIIDRHIQIYSFVDCVLILTQILTSKLMINSNKNQIKTMRGRERTCDKELKKHYTKTTQSGDIKIHQPK